jgi:hypothetical protein
MDNFNLLMFIFSHFVLPLLVTVITFFFLSSAKDKADSHKSEVIANIDEITELSKSYWMHGVEGNGKLQVETEMKAALRSLSHSISDVTGFKIGGVKAKSDRAIVDYRRLVSGGSFEAIDHSVDYDRFIRIREQGAKLKSCIRRGCIE